MGSALLLMLLQLMPRRCCCHADDHFHWLLTAVACYADAHCHAIYGVSVPPVMCVTLIDAVTLHLL